MINLSYELESEKNEKKQKDELNKQYHSDRLVLVPTRIVTICHAGNLLSYRCRYALQFCQFLYLLYKKAKKSFMEFISSKKTEHIFQPKFSKILVKLNLNFFTVSINF